MILPKMKLARDEWQIAPPLNSVAYYLINQGTEFKGQPRSMHQCENQIPSTSSSARLDSGDRFYEGV